MKNNSIIYFSLQRMRVWNSNKKNRIWFYQFPGDIKRQILKQGKYWKYQDPNSMGSVGCSSLNDAKGDLIYSGANVWSELV